MSSCLEAQGIQSIGFSQAFVVNENSLGSGGTTDSIVYFLYEPIPANCDVFIEYVVESGSNPCGIAITRIAVLYFSNLSDLINAMINMLILLNVIDILRWE